MNRDFAIVILAAGLGTRLKSRQAKVLHRAGGKTLIELVAATAVQLAPAGQVYVVVGHQADQVQAAAGGLGVRFGYRIDQDPATEDVQKAAGGLGVRFLLQEPQLGTGHAVLIARQELESGPPRVLVLYGDCPLVRAATLESLMRQHVDSGAAATVLTTRLPDPTGYGRMVRGPGGRLLAIVEQKAATAEQRAISEINSGIYCFETGPLFECLSQVRPDNPAGEYYLTDVIAALVGRRLPVETASTDDPAEVLGINTRVELAEVDALLRARKARELMLAGVTIQRPETVTLDADVAIGPDTLLEPFVQVLGRTRIGERCRVRSYAIISDSLLGDEVLVEPYTWIDESEVAAGARIGPYARLRRSSRVEAGAQIGNFVELKKTRLGARSRAMHLTYLGDSTIGEDVNIGAGTITCNYDGVTKNPTTIEDGAFVGSNSTLVAPVRVGRDAYLAAGSVITADVEPDALGIARSRQTVKPGWAARRRKKSPHH